MRAVLALLAALTFSAPAIAQQHSHGEKGPNGGPMEDVAGVHAELVSSGKTITINIFNEGMKPLPTKAYTGSVLVVSGSARETVTLAPSGENALKGEAKNAVGTGATVTLMLKTDAGKSGQARFKK